jgi:hypothetical protein
MAAIIYVIVLAPNYSSLEICDSDIFVLLFMSNWKRSN